jgi:protocatechuate 3,4-dioxygenase beta subunit
MIGLTMGRLATAALVFGVPLLAAPQQPRPTGFMLGRVVDAVTNRPIGGATVTLSQLQATPGDSSPIPSPPSSTSSNVLSDADGRFLFRGLGAGTYGLGAGAPTYLDGGFGQRRPGGRLQPFVLAASQRVGDLTIRLWKEAAISGHVLDETGAPIADVWVSVLRRDISTRPGQLPLTRNYSLLGAKTDDQGAYRVAGIDPGEYVVLVGSRLVQVSTSAARPDPAMLQSLRLSGSPDVGATTRAVRFGESLILVSYDGFAGGSNALSAIMPMTLRADGRTVGYPATFHPSATAITNAQTLTLGAGDDRSGVNVQLRPVPMVSVSGTLQGPDGPAPHFAVHLLPAFAAGTDLERVHSTALTTTNGSGAFSFVAVPPGPYVVKAWRRTQGLVTGRDPLPPDTTLWAETPITVADLPLSGLSVTLQPGGVLGGRVRFEGATPPPMPGPLQPPLSVAFEPMWSLAFGTRLGVHVSPAFEFTTLGLPSGKYFVGLPNQFSVRGWFFESATLEGRDLTVIPIELAGQRVSDITITYSDRRSEITGSVLDKDGRPDTTASVLVFPADYRSWIQHGLWPMAARMEVVSQTGTFSMPMRPGDYLVAAIDDDTLQSWSRAGGIEAIARVATAVTIARGESKRVELRRGAR